MGNAISSVLWHTNSSTVSLFHYSLWFLGRGSFDHLLNKEAMNSQYTTQQTSVQTPGFPQQQYVVLHPGQQVVRQSHHVKYLRSHKNSVKGWVFWCQYDCFVDVFTL